MEEERRLAYVGLTRARHRLYLTHAATRATWGRGGFSMPSRFLLEIPADLMHGPRLVAPRRTATTTSARPTSVSGGGYDLRVHPEPARRHRGWWAGGLHGRPRSLPPGGGYTSPPGAPAGAPRDGEPFRPSRDLAARRAAYYGRDRCGRG